MKNSNALERLKKLVQLAQMDKIEIGAFCEEFERIYNFDIEKANLSKKERKIFEALFDKVIYFSPYVHDLEKIPNYLSD